MLQQRADGGKHISTASHIRQEIIEAGGRTDIGSSPCLYSYLPQV